MYKKINDAIKKHKTIIIHRHQKPDGDALGSQFGLKALLLDNFKDKRVLVVGSEDEYSKNPIKNIFNEPFDEVTTEDYEGSLVIVVDTANIERINGTDFIKSSMVIKIDHHASGEKFGDIELVLDKRSSCSEIISELAWKMKWNISKKASEYLMTGIITDSGRFMYNSVSDQTFFQASVLSKSGAKTSKISGLLNDRDINFVRLQGKILSDFSIEGNVAYYVMPKGMHEKYNVNYNTASSMVFLLMGAKEIKYGIYSTYDVENNVWKTSLRSKAKEINKIAEKYNGGGHAMASGAKLKDKKEFNKLLNEILDLSK